LENVSKNMKRFGFLIPFLILLAACAPSQPTATGEPVGGAVYINSTDLLVAESYPVQIFLHITGDLPTPCHEFRSQVAEPDEQKRINVIVWSDSDPEMVCIQVLEPFDVNLPIPMKDAAEGSYTVWLNGELVGEFIYPA